MCGRTGSWPHSRGCHRARERRESEAGRPAAGGRQRTPGPGVGVGVRGTVQTQVPLEKTHSVVGLPCRRSGRFRHPCAAGILQAVETAPRGAGPCVGGVGCFPTEPHHTRPSYHSTHTAHWHFCSLTAASHPPRGLAPTSLSSTEKILSPVILLSLKVILY